MLLIEPTMEYAKDIEAYRQEFLDMGNSMDGCGSLRRCATGAEWIEKSVAGKDPKNVEPGRVPATQYIYVREDGASAPASAARGTPPPCSGTPCPIAGSWASPMCSSAVSWGTRGAGRPS